METQIKNETPILTFREVHADLERESIFLQKNHDINNFKEKGDFLKEIGLSNSIATKLYSGIAENNELIKDYSVRYPNNKTIIEPQLERLCEKYDLYVRPLSDFLGDIPENNIKHLMNFQIRLKDVPFELFPTEVYRICHTLNSEREEVFRIIMKLPILGAKDYLFKILTQVDMRNGFFHPIDNVNPLGNFISLRNFCFIFGDLAKSFIEIASVKKLLSPTAFSVSEERILGIRQLEAKNMIELDPIILFRVRGARMIITAWGDESNDELVFNQQNN